MGELKTIATPFLHLPRRSPLVSVGGRWAQGASVAIRDLPAIIDHTETQT
jgi:hypothetical protein